MSGETIRAIIVDDELPARKGLRKMLERDAEISIISECRDGVSAVEAIRREKPDLLFLDIQMPVMTGFDVLKALSPEERPLVVFITAYNQYAVDAFEVHAVDYLLKPLQEERFLGTLRHVKSELKRKREGSVNRQLDELLHMLKEEKKMLEKVSRKDVVAEQDTEGGSNDAFVDRFVVKSNGRITFVKTENIDWVEATGDYVTLHTKTSSHLIRETMNALELKLDPKKFIRIHRSAIVNFDRIQELKPLFAGDYLVILQNGARLTLTRTYRARFDQMFLKETK